MKKEGRVSYRGAPLQRIELKKGLDIFTLSVRKGANWWFEYFSVSNKTMQTVSIWNINWLNYEYNMPGKILNTYV